MRSANLDSIDAAALADLDIHVAGQLRCAHRAAVPARYVRSESVTSPAKPRIEVGRNRPVGRERLSPPRPLVAGA